MKKFATPLFAALVIGVAMTGAVAVEDLLIDIQVSPHTVVLKSKASGDWLTVHTDIPYSAVVPSSVCLDGETASLTKADDCGFLVAKFDLTLFKSKLSPPSAQLTLTGVTTDGGLFQGADTVGVK